jgi:putative flippase GtrA
MSRFNGMISALNLPADEIRRFALFVMVGFLAAIVSIISRALLSRFTLFEVAVALAQLIGLAVAFSLGRMIVFTEFTGSVATACRRFAIVNLVSLTIATFVSALFYRTALPFAGWSFYPDYTAHFIGLGAATLPSYFGHRFYSFRS